MNYPRYISPKVRSYIERRVMFSGCRTRDREDLVQKILIGIDRARGDFDPTRNTSFDTYCKRIADRIILREYRDANRIKRLLVVPALDEECRTGDDQSGERHTRIEFVSGKGHLAFEQLGFDDALLQVFLHLTPEQRKVCREIMDGVGQPTIADEMFGMDTKTFQRKVLNPIRKVFREFWEF